MTVLPGQRTMEIRGGEVDLIGDTSGAGAIVAENERAIVVKWPSGSHWVANNAPWEYHSPRSVVYLVDEVQAFSDFRRLRVREIVHWEHKRRGAASSRASAMRETGPNPGQSTPR